MFLLMLRNRRGLLDRRRLVETPAVPAVLAEAVFLIQASQPDGPPLNLPLLGATFLIDATMETY